MTPAGPLRRRAGAARRAICCWWPAAAASRRSWPSSRRRSRPTPTPLHAGLRQPQPGLDDVQATSCEDLKDRHLDAAGAAPGVLARGGRLAAARRPHRCRQMLQAVIRLAGPVDEAFVCGPHAMNDERRGRAARGRPERARRSTSSASACRRTARRRRSTSPHPGDAAAARIRIVRDGVTREVGFLPGDAVSCSTPRRAPVSTCRTRASAASAPPAAPSCSKAACAWTATSRSNPPISTPASC